jgi:uncharacterized repeat protein (TIGR03803 family)
MKLNTRTIIGKALAIAVFAAAITISAVSQTESAIYSFTNGIDGGYPNGGVAIDSKGNLYGTAVTGGANEGGAVFQLSPKSGGGWTESVIYSFNFTSDDGDLPCSGLVFDSHGNLYGQTLGGGTAGGGVIFELSPGSNGEWTQKTLYSFGAGIDGDIPFQGTLAIDGSGNLYGFTQNGGTYGFGTIFELTAGSDGTWNKRILHSFAELNDGGLPYAEQLVLDSSGNVYGTTLHGGAAGYGVAFKLIRQSNGSWKEEVLHSFTGGLDGSGPEGGVVLDAVGNVYGSSGPCVFQLSPGSNGAWTFKSLHAFHGGTDGAEPDSILTFDKAGNLYGTTYRGGENRGTVFQLTPQSNGSWTESILARFSLNAGGGAFPFFSGVAIDSYGNLYGTTYTGGTSNSGVVYEIVR